MNSTLPNQELSSHLCIELLYNFRRDVIYESPNGHLQNIKRCSVSKKAIGDLVPLIRVNAVCSVWPAHSRSKHCSCTPWYTGLVSFPSKARKSEEMGSTRLRDDKRRQVRDRWETVRELCTDELVYWVLTFLLLRASLEQIHTQVL